MDYIGTNLSFYVKLYDKIMPNSHNVDLEK